MRMRLTLGLVSLLAVWGPTQSAMAQTAIPPSAGPCTVNGSTAICEGDLSAGVNVDGSVIDHLIVQNLTQNITPAFDVEAIDFRDGGAATGITLDVDLGRFGVSVDSEPAVYIEEDGIGDVVVNFFGDITATGPRGGGIIILETGAGGISVTHEGDITTDNTPGDAIYASSKDGGNVTVQSVGNLTTSGDISAGIFADSFDGAGDIRIIHEGEIVTSGNGSDGIQAEAVDEGDIYIDHKGAIEVTGLSAYGIYADTEKGMVNIFNAGNVYADTGEGIAGFSRTGDVVISSTGDIYGGLWGISGQVETGNVLINSVGDVTGDQRDGIEAYTEGGNILIASTGNVVSNNEEGIDAEIVDGDGNININVQGSVTAEDEAVDASIKGSGNGNITINSNAHLSSNDVGIDGAVANDGVITINNFGDIDSTNVGLRAALGGTGQIYIANHGDVLADVALLVDERFDVAPVQVINSGRLEGTGGHAVDFRSDGNDVLNLLNGSIVIGALDFGNGNDGAGGANPDDIDVLNIETGVSAVLDFADTGGTGQGDTDLESAPEIINYDGFSILLNGGTRLATIDPTIFAQQDRLLLNLNNYSLAQISGAKIGVAPDPDMATLWGKLYGGVGHVAERTGTSAFQETDFGFIGGFENDLNAKSTFGLFAGTGLSNYTVRANSDHTGAESFYAGAHWRQQFDELIISAHVTAGAISNQTERHVNGEVANGAFWGQFFAPTLAVTMPLDALDQNGYFKAQIGYSFMQLDGYDETGGPAPLSVDARHISKLSVRGEVGAPIEMGGMQMNWRAGLDGVVDAGSSQVNATLLGTDVSFNGNLTNGVSGFVGLDARHSFADGRGELTLSGELASSLAGDLSAKASAKAAVNF